MVTLAVGQSRCAVGRLVVLLLIWSNICS